MYVFLAIIIVIAAILLIGAVLIQKSKGMEAWPPITQAATSIWATARPRIS